MRLALAALALLLASPAAAAAPTAHATPAAPDAHAAPAAHAARPAGAGKPHAAEPGAHGATAAPPDAPVAGALVLFQALGRPTQVTVTGRALAAPDQAGRAAAKGLARAVVEVSLSGQVRRVRAGADGLFEATFAAPSGRPWPVGRRTAEAASGAASAEGQVQVVDDGAPFLLVLEADDLVGLGARRGAPGEEAASPAAMAALLRCVVAGTRPEVGAVAVVGSGGDQAARVQAALAEGGFPFTGLVARPPAPRGAGQEAALRAILSSFPNPVLLLGDAGGRAPERFAALRAEFPGRVVGVYVRGSATGAGDRRFDDMTLFTDPLQVARHAAARGLADQACVERALSPPPAAPPEPAPIAAPAPNGPAAAAPPAAPLACPPCPCAVPEVR